MKALFYYCINSGEEKKVEIHVPDNLKDNEDYTKDFKTKKKQERVDKVEDHIKKRFFLQKKIGQGAYGVVFKATDRKTKEVVALKKLFGAFQDDTDSQRTFREVCYYKN